MDFLKWLGAAVLAVVALITVAGTAVILFVARAVIVAVTVGAFALWAVAAAIKEYFDTPKGKEDR